MLTFLWSKGGFYYGLDGSKFESNPEASDIVALQQYSRQFVNDPDGYRDAFNKNVAPILGLPADWTSFKTYFDGDSSCAINICNVTASIQNNGGQPNVESYAVKTDEGCYNLHFDFYNLDCESCNVRLGKAVRYADNSSGYGMSTNPQGKDYVGIAFTTNAADLERPESYAWFQINCGDDGLGVTSFQVYAFKRATSLSQDERPSGGTFTDPAPTNDWSLGVSGNARFPIWMSIRQYYSDNRPTEWSKPQKMSDSKTFQTEWAGLDAESFYNRYQSSGGFENLPNLNNFIDGNNQQEGIDENAWRAAASAQGCGTWNDNGNGATFMAWANCRDGKWDDWSISRIAGKDGTDGHNGGRTFMIFATLETEDTPDTPQGGFYVVEENILTGVTPTYWSTDNNSSNGKYTWLSTGTFDADGRQVGEWSKPVRITGEDGIDGTDGENREYIYKRFKDKEAYDCYVSGSTEDEGECGALRAEFEADLMPFLNAESTAYDEEYQESPDFLPHGWSDHPEGVEEDMRIEACCVRVRETVEVDGEQKSVWGPFIGPFIWASWGEDGIDGDGVEYIFKITTVADTCFSYIPTTAENVTYVVIDELPEPTVCCGSIESCTGFENEYVRIGSETGDRYVRKTEFVYPSIPGEFPLPAGDSSAETYNSIVNADGTYTDVQKKVLWEYYQNPGFVPGNKIENDLTDSESELRKILADNNVDVSDTDFISAWDSNWTDNPLDVGPQQPYEWVSIRKYKKGTHDTTKTWLGFSEPKLWANWAYDGTSTFTSMVFTRTNDNISGMHLCGGTFDVPMPGASGEEPFSCTTQSEDTVIVYDPETNTSTATYKDKDYVWEDTVPFDLSYSYELITDMTGLEVSSWGSYSENPTADSPEYVTGGTPSNKYYYRLKESYNDSSIWMSMRIFGDEETGEGQGWTSPRRMSDTSDFNVEFCITELNDAQIERIKSSEFNFGVFTEAQDNDDSTHTKAEAAWEAALEEADCGKWSDVGDGAIYMATTSCRNGKWTNWTVTKIKGEKGDAGIGITMYGSTKGVVKEFGDLGCVLQNAEVGDIWCVFSCNAEDIPCIDDDDLEIHAGPQFFECQQNSTGKYWECIACRTYYDYVESNASRFIEKQQEDPTKVSIVSALPSEILENSPEFIHVTGTTQAKLNEYYEKVVKRFVDEGVTIVINGITEDKEGCQLYTAEQLSTMTSGNETGVTNGDFFVWDTDSWHKTTNLLGPGSYMHVKFADDFIIDEHEQKYYRLTEPEAAGESHGEVPGTYMGTYVDEKKGDDEGVWGDAYGPNDASRTRRWCAAEGPYVWVKVVGDDGLGYEYIYAITNTNLEYEPGHYETDGRPFVPRFDEQFMKGSVYQKDGFVPTSAVGNEFIDYSYCLDWEDNPINCDENNRYRWMCYRVKTNGVWGPFIGDKSSANSIFDKGLYGTFDANYSVDGESVLMADFDNDTIAIGCTDEGDTAEAMTVSLKPIMHKGSTALTVTSCTKTEGDLPVGDFNTSTKTIDLTIPTGTHVLPNAKVKFTIGGYYVDPITNENVGESGEATVTVIGIKGNTIYSLIVSKAAIKKDDEGRVKENDPLTCSVVKRVVGSTQTVPVSRTSEDDDDYMVTYQVDDETNEYAFANNLYDTPAEQEAIEDKIVFRLYTRINKSLAWPADFSDKSNLVLNDVETVCVVSDGEKGESPFVADIDNELDSVPLTYEGKVEAEAELMTSISMFYGRTEVEIQGVSATTGTTQEGSKTLGSTYKSLGTGIQAKKDGNTVIVKLAENMVFPETSLEIRIYASGSYNGTNNISCMVFTITGVKAGKQGESATIYQLSPSVSFITKSEDGTREPGTFTCTVLKKTGKTVEELVQPNDITVEELVQPNDIAHESLKIVYGIDDGDYSYTYTGEIPTATVDKKIKLALIPLGDTSVSSDNMYDRESVPVVKNGAAGRSLLAKCDYWCANNYEHVDDTGFPAKTSDVWVKDGQYYLPTDTNFSNKQEAHNAIPLPDANKKYLWKWEKSWYSDITTYETNIALVSDYTKEITAIEKWYIIGYDTTSSKSNVRTRYQNCVNAGFTRTAIQGQGFTEILANTDIPELKVVDGECQIRWEFQVYRFSDGSVIPNGIEIVETYYKILKDFELLTNAFGVANVDAKEGAYLREFLGVMNTDDGFEGDFTNGNVCAFLNATGKWKYQGEDLQYDSDGLLIDARGHRGRLMFASGVDNLGGYDSSGVIDMTKFHATTKIWESGLIECSEANITGTINATGGKFGKDSAYITIDDTGLLFMTNNGQNTAIKLGATSSEFNGKISATEGQIGCLKIDADGTIGHTANTPSKKVFEITPLGQFTVSQHKDDTVNNAVYDNTLSSEGIAFSSTTHSGNIEVKSFSNYLAKSLSYSQTAITPSYNVYYTKGWASSGITQSQTLVSGGTVATVESNYSETALTFTNQLNGFSVHCNYTNSGITFSTRGGQLRIESGGYITTPASIHSASGFYQDSDARKKNIGEPLSNVLSKIDDIPTVYYSWKNDTGKTKHIGTIAQDVYDVFPELVGTSDDTYQTVDYSKFSIIAIAAIKELKTELETLKKELEKIKERNE